MTTEKFVNPFAHVVPVDPAECFVVVRGVTTPFTPIDIEAISLTAVRFPAVRRILLNEDGPAVTEEEKIDVEAAIIAAAMYKGVYPPRTKADDVEYEKMIVSIKAMKTMERQLLVARIMRVSMPDQIVEETSGNAKAPVKKIPAGRSSGTKPKPRAKPQSPARS